MEPPLVRRAVWLGVTALLATSTMALPADSRTPENRGGERLLVAIALDEAVPPPTLAGHLHLADPHASVVVVIPGDAPLTAGPFTVEVRDVADGPDAQARIASVAGDPLVVPLGVGAPDEATPAPAGAFLIVQALAGTAGIVAHRIGDLVLAPDELRLPSWRLPGAGVDAVMIDHAWWSLGPGPAPATAHPGRADRVRLRHLRDRLTAGRVQDLRRIDDLSIGDVTGDGRPDLAVTFRRPFRTTFLNAGAPDVRWQDADGMSAHVGLLRPDDLTSIWVAGTVVTPVARLAACDGAIAVVHDGLDDPRIVAGGAWDWEGFGFGPLPELPGQGAPVCIDIDRDGQSDPAIVERS